MKKFIFILSFMFLSIGLFGCQHNNEEKFDNVPSNTESIKKITISKIDKNPKAMVLEY